MTWEPRNKTNDGHESDDKDSLVGSEDDYPCSNNNNNNSSRNNDSHNRSLHVRCLTSSSPNPQSTTVNNNRSSSSHNHPHNNSYPIVKTESLTTITDLSCSDKRLSHHHMGKSLLVSSSVCFSVCLCVCIIR